MHQAKHGFTYKKLYNVKLLFQMFYILWMKNYNQFSLWNPPLQIFGGLKPRAIAESCCCTVVAESCCYRERLIDFCIIDGESSPSARILTTETQIKWTTTVKHAPLGSHPSCKFDMEVAMTCLVSHTWYIVIDISL